MSFLSQAEKHSIKDAVEGIVSTGSGERFVLSGLTGSSKAYILAKSFLSSKKPFLVVLPDNEIAEEFAHDLEFFLKKENIRFYPATELLPFERQETHPEIAAKRMEFLHSLAIIGRSFDSTSFDPSSASGGGSGRTDSFDFAQGRPFIAVTSAANLVEKLPPREAIKNKIIKLSKGAEHPRETLILTLLDMGYRKMTMVEERGEFSVRGGIVDIFPPSEKYPLRLELSGDEVETIRTFDPITQRSQRELAEVSILPAKAVDLSIEARNLAKNKLLERVEELSLKRGEWEPLYNSLREGENLAEAEFLLPLFYEKLETIFDYLPQDTVIALIDPSKIFEETDGIFIEAKERAASEKSIIRPDELFLDRNSLDKLLEKKSLIAIEPFKSEGVIVETESNLDLRQDIALKKDLSPLKKMLKDRLDEGFSVFVTAHNKAQAERFASLLEDFRIINVSGQSVIENIKSTETPAIQVCEGAVSTGFRLPSEKLILLAEEEIFGERVKRRPPKSGKPIESFISQLKDLSEDDFVVHSLHGIGQYKGLKRISVPSDTGAGGGIIESDFLLLEYKDKDRLYVPVGRLDLITKYHGAEGAEPETDKLGGVGWEKKKGKVKKAVNLLAVELIKLYAERSLAKGYAFNPPNHLFTEFEMNFEYDETPDQMRAIEDVMKDMGNETPMDRLICGDVGYGKTEVAMRAAFRAVSDSKQACVLVPTTILAQQHYLTFKKRFAPFPVSIEVLSRFRSKKEQMETLDKLSAGKVDIVIGTHRLLQKDVSFKDLGLLVIDEEHRFGVKHKEKLKNLKKGVDVLTLTATPIPRTLHMAFADLRAMSIINTPPEDRLAITTRVIRLDDTVIREAIERELKRGGQVFFVHNRVEGIEAMREYLLRITSGIKEAIKIGVGHGQMKEDSLEKVMLGFTEKKYDILLTTTIIESGLDIPSANTIIINRADRFGLAELYQLRGRVGRSSHRAYAYLVCPEDSSLAPDAIKRMDVIRELSELGGGFRLAAYDLEIRGAGELLGQAQSGHIAEVGFDMYTEILEEAVSELRGETVTREAEPEVDIKASMYIPDDYVPDARQKITLYKRLATASSEDELSLFEEELVDRYGEIPELVRNLIGVSELKILMKKISATELSRRGNRLYLSFTKGLNEKRPGLAEKIIALAKKEPDRLKLQPDSRLVCVMNGGEGEKRDVTFEARYLLKELTQGW